MIPQVEQCPPNTTSDEDYGTTTFDQEQNQVITRYFCICDDICRWDICRIEKPPTECLSGTNSFWFWDSQKMHWVAQRNKGKELRVI